ncbi:cell division protein FtsQ/DivIB [Planktotalea sp.]|uniref:cell division protein FtsQ/DivIB n=1 Tax=Planktotalea sp. TaxID=2029877 RepID=UPI0025FF859A|nr:cell division protein FtsQ/DivIB [Planktotalea sp.]
MQQVGAAGPRGPQGQGARVLNRSTKRRKADPAPSRWSYRFQRLMLTPLFRFSLRVGVPFALTFSLGMVYLSDEGRRTELQDVVAQMRSNIEERPEFMIQLMEVEGASEDVASAIHEIVPIKFPISSFDLELASIQKTVSSLNPVRSADVRLQPGGVLEVVIDERETAALWRTHDGLFRIDAEGVYIGLAHARSDFPELPVLAGEGADTAVVEAKNLMKIAAPLGSRVVGLVRMGARRWDLVLDREQRVMLPAKGAARALERVIALDQMQDVLERDLARVDMRLSQRPTIRMNENAVKELWRIKTTAVENR